MQDSIAALKAGFELLVRNILVLLAPQAHRDAWSEALPKFRTMVGVTRHLGLGLAGAAVVSVAMCAS
eukprot:2403432-Pyramimonas_sp.AAC.1